MKHLLHDANINAMLRKLSRLWPFRGIFTLPKNLRAKQLFDDMNGSSLPAMTNLSVVGAGYWGPNLIRNIHENPRCTLRTICDRSEERLVKMRERYGSQVTVCNDFNQLLSDERVDAVIVATDAPSHFELARQALLAGKHVLVEKPLATSLAHCEELGRLADTRGLHLMVGHTFLYSPAVLRIKEMVLDGTLGDISYLHARRLNLGRIQTSCNALWSLAVHDISIALFLFDELPVSVKCWGRSLLGSGVEDVAFLLLEFQSGRMAHIHVSWLDPQKSREITIVGSRCMVTYDDVSVDQKITIHQKNILRSQAPPAPLRDYNSFGEFQYLIRSGDLMVPQIPFTEPLAAEVDAFLDLLTGKPESCRSDWRRGAEVVAVMDAADRSLKNGGLSETVRYGSSHDR
jgi:predicted dehydrogenase